MNNYERLSKQHAHITAVEQEGGLWELSNLVPGSKEPTDMGTMDTEHLDKAFAFWEKIPYYTCARVYRGGSSD